jgi:hypothetical protein
MKKAYLESLVSLLDGEAIENADEIREAIVAELDKGKAKAEANRAVYADMHDKVIEAIRIANAPVTAQDIADATGLARGKVVYGLTSLWNKEVHVDNSGKANLYTIA